jgi:FkbM family methyltransferase
MKILKASSYRSLAESIVPPNVISAFRRFRDDRTHKANLKKLYTYFFNNTLFGFYGQHLGSQFKSREDSGELAGIRDILLSNAADCTFIDVGANQGLFTLLALSCPQVKTIIAIEPCFQNYQLLLRNISLFESHQTLGIHTQQGTKFASPKVLGLHLAIGDQNKPQALYGGLEGASLLKGWGNMQHTYEEYVQVATLDFITTLTTQVNSKKVIKIDVEGLEDKVLLGAKELISSGNAEFIVEASLSENKTLNDEQFKHLFEFMFSSEMEAFTFPGGEAVDMRTVEAWIEQARDGSRLHATIPNRTLNIHFKPRHEIKIPEPSVI